jgi:hypothetical protein
VAAIAVASTRSANVSADSKTDSKEVWAGATLVQKIDDRKGLLCEQKD